MISYMYIQRTASFTAGQQKSMYVTQMTKKKREKGSRPSEEESRKVVSIHAKIKEKRLYDISYNVHA